jgi:hypothetical protein
MSLTVYVLTCDELDSDGDWTTRVMDVHLSRAGAEASIERNQRHDENWIADRKAQGRYLGQRWTYAIKAIEVLP